MGSRYFIYAREVAGAPMTYAASKKAVKAKGALSVLAIAAAAVVFGLA